MNEEAADAQQQRVFEVLRDSSVFGSLEEGILKALAAAIELRHVHGGERIISEGQNSDSIVFVISGGLRVSRQDKTGQILLYNQVQPGQSIGELGLILGQPRAQDVTAVRDSTLAVLNRAAYEALLQRFPLQLSQVFLKAVYDRLRNVSEAGERRMAQTFALIPLNAEVPTAELARELTLALARQGRVVLLRTSIPDDELARLEDAHEFIVYEASAKPEALAWTRRAFRQADQLIFVANADAAPGLEPIERSLAQEAGYALKRKHLALLHADQRALPTLPGPWLQGRDLERIYPMRLSRRRDAERLARFLTGSAVGVVLGGGGARGFAHLGVLRALNEASIPVDLIGGNSMGALIAAQYACGHDLQQILSQTQRFAAGGEWPALPLVSLVRGRRVERDLQAMFGDQLIEQLWKPYFAAACNLSLGSTQVLDSGPLWKAVLASNSPAGLLPPVLHQGSLLVDGAILENVPVQPMRMRLGTPLERRRGNGLIIAIDVDVRESLFADAKLERLSTWSTFKRMAFKNAPASPGIADILYSASHVGGVNQRFRTIAQADHYLEPPVAEFTLMAYGRGADIAEVGYRYAMEKIGEWDILKQRT
ncbi:cyclic nucleotide-binding and patatin-like phospholipase domain-containing protein [Paucibacter sp. Y2R2-4]|uniref:cyclic nucleotide-binding and patatin-like phospholipase domain-containing protein n=1 Tax=Paucibacter sp. Y2R2-4 TaxID=2893553 RepID=UPI0021E4916F|nr:cyclic nucleotide-binding and patatin-like phospholipase domain-containing protein [Paucibacter sp. Y2R2-4]MCV2352101.1 patatin-like phospholipase family protein [Paucibacter sp. Y2R2-4]